MGKDFLPDENSQLNLLGWQAVENGTQKMLSLLLHPFWLFFAICFIKSSCPTPQIYGFVNCLDQAELRVT